MHYIRVHVVTTIPLKVMVCFFLCLASIGLASSVGAIQPKLEDLKSSGTIQKEKQLELGLQYINGQGVSKNPAKAFKIFKQLAEQGYGPAQTNLGLLYLRGEGVVHFKV